MTELPTATQFVFFYIGQIIAFSLCFIIIEQITRPVVIWLISNVFGALGFIILPSHLIADPELAVVLGGFCALYAGALKALAFSDSRFMRSANRWAHLMIVGSLVAAILLFVKIETPYRLFYISISGLLISIAAILYLRGNRKWVGLRAAVLTEAVLWLSAMVFFYRLIGAYPFGVETKFNGDGKNISANPFMLVAFQFMLQISFLAMIISRQSRERLLHARRATRRDAESSRLRQKQNESAELADERFQLLKMLTHEVRQPLNTAQAALQSVIEEIGHGNAKPDQVRPVLDRALVTLNSIALSISNSILGATLITKGRTAQFQMIDLCSISQMALLDINPADRARIVHRFAQDVIFAEADPIVLRLAIRNLLENALKYSPAKSEVLFQLQVDEIEMGAIFTITNEVANLSTLDGDIFGLEKRGADSRYEGFGLGLYIVKEVAVMHRGHLDYTIADDKKVTFALHLPC